MANDTPLCVLVIEDDADTQANIRDILDLDGYRVITASTFAEALDCESWDDISAILLDRKLPDGNAEQMLPRLRQLARHASIVVVTGYPDVEGAIGALREGANDYILKPINPDALRASLRRISEHRRAERALQESQERLRAILHTAADAIITIDQQGMITGVNPATERMFGYRQEELIGKNVSILMPSPYREEHDGYIARYVKTGQARIIGIGREAVGCRKDGSTFPVDLAVSQIEHLGFTGIIRDISERKELQKQVLEIAAEEDRRIGHELHDNTQQQLTGLGLLAQSLAETLTNKHAPEAAVATRVASGINEAARHVHLLARGLVPVEVDAQGLHASLTDLASRIGEQRGVQCDFQHDRPVKVTDNFMATHLYRITQEAITNALKHGRPDRIVISLAESNGDLILKVIDNGIGIGIGDTRAAGAGMGLRIMAYRAGLIGATFQVGSGLEGGTQVTCTVLRGREVNGD